MPTSKKTLTSLIEGGTFEERLDRSGSQRPVLYRLDGRYQQDDAIDHARFGIGFVLEVHNDRIHVLFSDGVKVLACAPSRAS
jgi:hypothetical protein